MHFLLIMQKICYNKLLACVTSFTWNLTVYPRHGIVRDFSSLGCSNKLGGIEAGDRHFSRSGGCRSGLRSRQIRCLVRPLADASLHPHRQRRSAMSYSGPNPSVGAPPVPVLTLSLWGLGFNIRILRGREHLEQRTC